MLKGHFWAQVRLFILLHHLLEILAWHHILLFHFDLIGFKSSCNTGNHCITTSRKHHISKPLSWVPMLIMGSSISSSVPQYQFPTFLWHVSLCAHDRPLDLRCRAMVRSAVVMRTTSFPRSVP